jgi:hypothetical protein
MTDKSPLVAHCRSAFGVRVAAPIPTCTCKSESDLGPDPWHVRALRGKSESPVGRPGRGREVTFLLAAPQRLAALEMAEQEP